MKNTFLVLFAAAALLLAGCEKPLESTAPTGPEVTSLGKAGTGFTHPNSFNGGGLLSVRTNGMQELNTPMELWMGVGSENAGTLVGHVTFLSNPSRVRIDLNDFDGNPGPDMFPFVATQIHIHFAPTLAGIPQTRQGNPIPGQFEYNVPVTDPYQTVYEIPVQFEAFGAIHLTVHRYGGIDGFNFWLPNNQVTLRVVDYPSAGDPTYFRIQVMGAGFISTYDSDGPGPLQAGQYEGWCIDVDRTIALNTNYSAYLYSSYESLPAWLVGPEKIEYPENLDKVNYLVNNFAAGQMVQVGVDGLGNPIMQSLTYGDIQRAIWTLMDNNASTNSLGNWSQTRVNVILAQVNMFGEGFVPTCNDKVVFLVVPTGTAGSFNVQVLIGQPVIGEIAVGCESASGTAWGDGYYGGNFRGSNWATYFRVVP